MARWSLQVSPANLLLTSSACFCLCWKDDNYETIDQKTVSSSGFDRRTSRRPQTLIIEECKERSIALVEARNLAYSLTFFPNAIVHQGLAGCLRHREAPGDLCFLCTCFLYFWWSKICNRLSCSTVNGSCKSARKFLRPDKRSKLLNLPVGPLQSKPIVGQYLFYPSAAKILCARFGLNAGSPDHVTSQHCFTVVVIRSLFVHKFVLFSSLWQELLRPKN